MIKITNSLSIPENALTFIASRSSGPGGQHVNKVNTRITLQFNVVSSPFLSDEQKQRILQTLKTRINHSGLLQLSSQAKRSQFANKEVVTARFVELLNLALQKKPKRKKTKIPKAVKQRRLIQKRKHGILKKTRSQKED